MTFTQILETIKQVGFPIAVAIYLLYRYDNRLRDMTVVLTEIAKTLSEIKGKLE